MYYAHPHRLQLLVHLHDRLHKPLEDYYKKIRKRVVASLSQWSTGGMLLLLTWPRFQASVQRLTCPTMPTNHQTHSLGYQHYWLYCKSSARFSLSYHAHHHQTKANHWGLHRWNHTDPPSRVLIWKLWKARIHTTLASVVLHQKSLR